MIWDKNSLKPRILTEPDRRKSFEPSATMLELLLDKSRGRLKKSTDLTIDP